MRRFVSLGWLVAAAVALFAADPKPIVGPGATKDEVIDAYGWPTGQSQSGTKEILNYPQGKVTIDNGRVEKVDFLMNVPWPAPRPRPGPSTSSTAKRVDVPIDFWLTDYEAAVVEGNRRHARILALFTGPDWSPASKQFHEDVEFHPDFVNSFTADFVFLRLEFLTRTAIAPELRDHNNRLRERYGVTTYPSLLVLATDGTEVARVDLAKPREGDTYRARVIAAVKEVRDLLALRPPDGAPAAGPAVGVAVAPEPPAPALAAVAAGLRAARSALTGALGIGVAIAVVLFWLVWRNWAKREGPRPKFGTATRISDAASGLPSPSLLATWPKEKLCALVVALAQADGHAADILPPGGDKDVVLKGAGDAKPRVLVCCAAAREGVVPTKRLRELFATMTVDGVEVGWFVSPAGFATDARAYAGQHRIVLVDAEHLLAQLRDLPPLVVPKVLARVG